MEKGRCARRAERPLGWLSAGSSPARPGPETLASRRHDCLVAVAAVPLSQQAPRELCSSRTRCHVRRILFSLPAAHRSCNAGNAELQRTIGASQGYNITALRVAPTPDADCMLYMTDCPEVGGG